MMLLSESNGRYKQCCDAADAKPAYMLSAGKL
jgi:hypothetical protein